MGNYGCLYAKLHSCNRPWMTMSIQGAWTFGDDPSHSITSTMFGFSLFDDILSHVGGTSRLRRLLLVVFCLQKRLLASF